MLSKYKGSHDKRSQAVEMGPKQSMWLVAAVIGQEVPAVWLQACLGETCSSESQQRLLMLAACHPACGVEHSLSLQGATLPAQDLGAKATLAALAEDPENDEMRAALNRRIEQHKSAIIKLKLIDLEVESCRDAHGNQQAIVDEPLKDMGLLKQFILTHFQCQVYVALDRFKQRQILRRKHFISDRPQAFIELELAGLMKEAPAPQGSRFGRPPSTSYFKRARAELDEASELELKRLGLSTELFQRQQ